MGLSSKLGTSPLLSKTGQFIAVQVIDASGSALATLADPNVRKNPNALGTVIFAVVAGFATGAGAEFIGRRIQIAAGPGRSRPGPASA